MLKPEQQAELRQAIEAWRRQNPEPGSVLAARALGFASQVAKANQAETAKPGSVFDLLKVDPLSGLDPATREIAQTRLFAERALFVTQKMPMLLRWQTELLTRQRGGDARRAAVGDELHARSRRPWNASPAWPSNCPAKSAPSARKSSRRSSRRKRI